MFTTGLWPLQGEPVTQHEVVASKNSLTDSEDPNASDLVKELV